MGNRGILHNERQQVTHYHRHSNWIICRLDYHTASGVQVQRPVMTPGRYTELFFLDEATALAAGHRPCGRCSKARYNAFVHYWRLGNPEETDKLDRVLQRERFIAYKRQWRAKKQVFWASN
jgi:hypothetical protein